jgi:predicted nucleic acid-binding protein
VGTLTVPTHGRVYLDTNTIIYAVERIEPYASVLAPLWPAVQQQAVGLVTSELTWLEALVKPLREQNHRLEALFRAFLTAQEITLVPATLPIWEAAARLRGRGLKTPDAVHAATGIAAHCTLFGFCCK